MEERVNLYATVFDLYLFCGRCRARSDDKTCDSDKLKYVFGKV